MSTDITNSREKGHNIWGFENVDKILETEVINKSSKISILPTELCTFSDFRLDLPDKSTVDLPSFLLQTETDGLAVLKNGAIVYEHYDRTNTKTSIHATFSITKSIAGLVCGILLGQGKLDINHAASIYVPEVKGSAYEGITVRQLLDMRSGVNHDDASPGYREATAFYPLESGNHSIDLHSYIPTIQSSPWLPMNGLDGPPYAYVSANADLIGWIIERASGKRFAQVLSEYIWQPLGAESNAYVALDRGGMARALCPKIGYMIWQHGSQAAFAAGPEKKAFKGIFDNVAYRQILMASGTNGQLLLVDRKNDLVMAKTSSQPERTTMENIRLFVQAFGEFTRIMREKHY